MTAGSGSPRNLRRAAPLRRVPAGACHC